MEKDIMQPGNYQGEKTLFGKDQGEPYGKLLTPFFIFHRKYFSNPTFIHLAQIAFFV
jgi:hypothetical protein